MPKLAPAFVILLISLAGCGSLRVTYKNPPGEAESNGDTGQPVYASLKIPPGHLPPPGSCRIWFPETPPGRQPPPGNCTELSLDIPAGAWLLYRRADQPRYVDVSVYDDRRPGVVIEVRIFEVETGKFVRIRG